MTPTRRVRRVLRWIETCGEMAPGAFYVHLPGGWRDFQISAAHEERIDTADGLFATELEFVATLAAVAIAVVSDGDLATEYSAAQDRIREGGAR